MDPRHESRERETLNLLIIAINKYVEENIDDIFTNEHIHDEIKKICSNIYEYIGVDVDVNGILSKQNLLSIDVVLFPHLDDVIESKFRHTKEFDHLIETIKLIVSHRGDGVSELDNTLDHILVGYSEKQASS